MEPAVRFEVLDQAVVNFPDPFPRQDRSEGLAEKLAQACPNGIGVYFENVGGPIWQAVQPLLNRFARVPMCGVIAHYNGATGAEQDLLPATMLAIVRRSLLPRGYINSEFVDEHYDAFLREIGPKIRSGDIRYREDIVDGLEKALSTWRETRR